MADALTTEDFGQLYTMLTSPDAATRTTALQASAKLTPDEAQQFFAYQHAVNRPDLAARRDQNVVTVGDVGVSPEMILGGAMATGKVAGALRTGGALAGAGEAVTQAAPLVKYEITKTALKAMGLPDPLAAIVGSVVVGYNPRSRAAVADAAETAAAAGPVDPTAPHLDRSVPVPASSLTREQLAERLRFGTGTPGTREPIYAPRPTPSVVEAPAPVVVEPPPAPAAPVAAAPSVGDAPSASVAVATRLSPTYLGSQLAIMGRRAGLPPGAVTAADQGALLMKVAKGAAPEDAIAEILAAKAAPPSALALAAEPPPEAITVAATPKPRISAAEVGAYTRLRSLGKSPQEAIDAIQVQQELAARLGTPAASELTWPTNKSGLRTAR